MKMNNILKVVAVAIFSACTAVYADASSPDRTGSEKCPDRPDCECKGGAKELQADTWTATDALGRELPGYDECGPRKENRTVGMFYFVTHNNDNNPNGPFNIAEIVKANPDNPQWGGGAHYWGEPETGYYIMKDEYMIRRHARMLTDAGVDVIIFDHTNDHIYLDVYKFICEVFRKMRAEGEPTPFVTSLASDKSALQLWENIYSRGLYADLWFYWKGKPLLMYGHHVFDPRPEVNDIEFPEEVRDFFTFRQSWAWTTLEWYDDGNEEWPWVDHYPQSVGWSGDPGKPEYVPVAPAEHPLSNIGRSTYNGVQPKLNKYDETDDTDKGLYFGQQWSRAIEVDPEFVFVTGWNEWTAGQMTRKIEDYEKEMERWDFFPGANLGKGGRKVEMNESYFIDQYNREFSRDLEPMKGYHTDNYYYQLMANVRRYKGVEKPAPAGPQVSINLTGSCDQWNKVSKTYYDHVGDTYHRNAPGNFAAGPYTNDTGRNDIVESKVARDDKNVYFYVKTNEDLTAHTDGFWMLLFIDGDMNHDTGWEGYDLLINHDIKSGNQTTVQTWKNGGWDKGKGISYRYEGNQLMISVPRGYFPAGSLAFDFHWADNIQKLGDLNEFLLNGDQAPERRANYRYEE